MSLHLGHSDRSTGEITWPGRVCFNHVFSHGGQLCSPLPLLLWNQELQVFTNRVGQGRRGSWQLCEKGCKYVWGKHFSPFLCFQTTKPPADRRVKRLIFHLLRIWSCEVLRPPKGTFRHHCNILSPPNPEAVADQKTSSLSLGGNNAVGQQWGRHFRSSC